MIKKAKFLENNSIYRQKRIIVVISKGLLHKSNPTLNLSATTSAGAKTPFSAYKLLSQGELNGKPVDFVTTFQAPGDALTFSDSNFAATFQVSTQAIPGYVPFESLNNFGPPIEITVVPGGTTTVTNPQALQTTPEPGVVFSLSVLSLGAFLKRKLSKNN